MSKYIKINKGLNIKLAGEAHKVISTFPLPETFVIKPPDFIGLTPKLLVKEGEDVQAGTALFCDKNNEAIKFCSPVSGEVIEIVRGEKRKLLEVKILADKAITYVAFNKANPNTLSREAILGALLNSGVWPFIRQRPFGIMANPNETPKSIFISAFDSNPLAPDNDFIMEGNDAAFQSGLTALQKLTPGKVHLNIHSETTHSTVFLHAKGVEINTIAGPHPSGNVGVQIHHIDPLNKGEVVWYIHPQDVLIMGKLFNDGKFDASRMIVLTGPPVKSPKYYKTLVGTCLKNIIEEGGLMEGVNRIISGNVLSGKQISPDGYLSFYDSQVTVIREGHEPEFMGWLAPGMGKFSLSRTFFLLANAQ